MIITPIYDSSNIDILKVPTNKTFKCIIDIEITEYDSIYLYNSSEFFKVSIDKNQTIDRIVTNVTLKYIKYLSLNIKFEILDSELEEFIIFCDHILIKPIFEQIYKYILKNKIYSKTIIQILFNHITQEQKIKLYSQVNDQKLFTTVSNLDLEMIKKANKIITYKLICKKSLIYLKHVHNSKIGKRTKIYYLNKKYDDLLSIDNEDIGNKEVTQIKKQKYESILDVLHSTNNTYLIPIVDQCIEDQEIELID